MWTREYLKTRAKAVLNECYWRAFLVSILLIVFGAESSGGSSGRGSGNGSGSGFFGNPQYLETLLGVLAFAALALVLIFAFRVFLGYAMEVGARKFFVRAAYHDASLGYLGYSFSGDKYLDIVKTMLLKGVYNFLWFLLLIIPGIVKSYAYSMVPYILTDNPNIGASRAIELSNQMTEGHKFDIFVLELSFIGWYLLGLILFIVGTFFVHPYVNATKAELYLALRENAIENGFTTAEELKLVPEV